MYRKLNVKPLSDFHLKLKLSAGEIVQRDLGPFLEGPVFASIRAHEDQFRQVRADSGTVV